MSGFDFEEDDTVLVRIRENGTSGAVVAKFVAECVDVQDSGPVLPPTAKFDAPWGNITDWVRLKPGDAEFERAEPDRGLYK